MQLETVAQLEAQYMEASHDAPSRRSKSNRDHCLFFRFEHAHVNFLLQIEQIAITGEH